VPAEVRRQIDPELHGSAFFVVSGSNQRPWLFPDKYYLSLLDGIPAGELDESREMSEYKHLKISCLTRCEWDEQGRMVLPQEVVEEAGVGTEISLVGSFEHLELWNRAEWLLHLKEIKNNRTEIERKGKEAIIKIKADAAAALSAANGIANAGVSRPQNGH